jgi:hypothetical protein
MGGDTLAQPRNVHSRCSAKVCDCRRIETRGWETGFPTFRARLRWEGLARGKPRAEHCREFAAKLANRLVWPACKPAEKFAGHGEGDAREPARQTHERSFVGSSPLTGAESALRIRQGWQWTIAVARMCIFAAGDFFVGESQFRRAKRCHAPSGQCATGVARPHRVVIQLYLTRREFFTKKHGGRWRR